MDNTSLLTAIYELQKQATLVALGESGLLSPEICQAEAYRIYTRRWVEAMETKGLLTPCVKPKKKGEKKKFKREDLVMLKIKEGNAQFTEHRRKIQNKMI